MTCSVVHIVSGIQFVLKIVLSSDDLESYIMRNLNKKLKEGELKQKNFLYY